MGGRGSLRPSERGMIPMRLCSEEHCCRLVMPDAFQEHVTKAVFLREWRLGSEIRFAAEQRRHGDHFAVSALISGCTIAIARQTECAMCGRRLRVRSTYAKIIVDNQVRAQSRLRLCKRARPPLNREQKIMPTQSMKRNGATVAVAAILTATSALADPIAVQTKYIEALDRGDVDAAVAFYAEDAVIDSQSGLCAAKPCVGKAMIRRDLERYLSDKSRKVTVLNTYVAGDIVFTRFEARSATVKKGQAERIVLWGMREIRSDKIVVSRCCMPDRTDAQTAKFVDWDYAHPSAP